MRRKSLAALCSIVAITTSLAIPADAKKWTITQRQEKLSSEIDSAFRANQLTTKEVEGLKKEAGKISEREQKMKEANAGRLSYSDQTSLERDLNKLSLKIHKKVLDKRVQ